MNTICHITNLSFSLILFSTTVIDIRGEEFESALEIARSQNIAMDIKEHATLGSKTFVNSGLKQHMTDYQSNHKEAMRLSLEGFEELARALPSHDIYRRADGLGNNVHNPRWGAAFHIQERLLLNSYQDGIGQPRILAASGNRLPSARTVSLQCFEQSKEEKPFFNRDSTQFLFQFGQFLDHDIIATAVEVAFGCCSAALENDTSSEEPCFPITIEAGDRFFHGDCMNFRRAFGVTKTGVREQVNTATSFVDASTIYGANHAEIKNLRHYKRGLLRVIEGNLLPLRNMFPCIKRKLPECPFSGDSRVSEVPGLTAIHLVYHRQHNRVAQKLSEVNPHWNDERLFQEARKIVTAQHQRIVYYEFLPKVVGPDVMRIMGIDRPHKYDSQINPSVINVFGGAAFRYGHTLINGLQHFKANEQHSLSQLFFRPDFLYTGEDVIKGIINNQAKRHSQKFDHFFTTEITDKLYLGVDSEAEPGESFDLLARNIQRGRDHGLQPYVKYLDYCLKRLRGIKGVSRLTFPTCLTTGIYESVDDIDVFTGGIYETPLPGAIVGPTFACIIAEQFYRLKFGDRFFFETTDSVTGFKPDQLATINQTASLASLICHNTSVKKIQQRVLDSRRSTGNHKQPCSQYQDVNFDLWKEYE